MDATDVDRWMDGYVQAWTTNDPEDIGRSFTDDARYYTAPYREPWEGREAIVAGWLRHKDEPGDWEFRSEILAIAEDLAFVRGWTRYPKEGKAYANLWVIRLRDGQASEFTEWWVEEPSE